MEAPPVAMTTATTTTTHGNYGGDSANSSPRSRNTDSWDEQPQYNSGGKVRLMCSYGGHIFPRPHDKCLSYVGGDTRIFVTDRNTSLAALSARLSKTLLNGFPFSLKYQLPNEDLDSLISVTTDEDLDNMIEEYDRINSSTSITSTKSSRLRLFLFPTNPDSTSSIGSLLENSAKSEDWFVHALNGATSTSTKVFSESSSVNCLLGLDDDIGNSTVKDAEGSSGAKNLKVSGQDVQSVPDSPMVDKTSSFGSTCSTPSLANLPPIRVHMEENQRPVAAGIEEQFSDMNIRASGGRMEQKQEDGGFTALSSPPPPAPSPSVPGVVGGEYASRVFSDDERSEQGMPMPVGYRQSAQSQQLPQMFPKPVLSSDLPSPDSISSDGSLTNPLSRQRHYIYQEQGVQAQSGSSRVQVQQDAGYALPVQYDQHPQMHQYVHAGQYIHHTPSGPVPMTSYFPVYQPQQQPHSQHPALDHHQYPLYFLPARPTQPYSFPVQQTKYSESASTAPSNRTQMSSPHAPSPAYNPPPSNPEMFAGGSYRGAAAPVPQLIQINAGQQYVGYSQVHHPSQSMTPTSATAAYEFADPAHAQIYYTQPLNPQVVAQYQTMTSSTLPESSLPLPTENVKQQARTSQP